MAGKEVGYLQRKRPYRSEKVRKARAEYVHTANMERKERDLKRREERKAKEAGLPIVEALPITLDEVRNAGG